MSAAGMLDAEASGAAVDGIAGSLAEPASCLLQLPAAALDLVLQQLDPCSLASTAMSCSKLSQTAPATMQKLVVHCSTTEAAANFKLWFEQHSTSLTSLQEFSFNFYDLIDCQHHPEWPKFVMQRLPFPLLRRLQLDGFSVYENSTSGSPCWAGVQFGDCTGLTALDLQHCDMGDAHAASAAIAALPQLRCLIFVRCISNRRSLPLPDLQQPLQFTHISCMCFDLQHAQELCQLSASVNLQHLSLGFDSMRAGFRVPGGVPSQLTQLTCLQVNCQQCSLDTAELFQHLSSLTAMQELVVCCDSVTSRDLASDLSGIQFLLQLTSLELDCCDLDFSTASTSTWACLTALQSLNLRGKVQPEPIAQCIQLRQLSLSFSHQVRAPTGQVLAAVSKLPLLTDLRLFLTEQPSCQVLPPTALTAVVASTNLRSALELHVPQVEVSKDWVIFRPGTVYPHLRRINLATMYNTLRVNAQQLQHLCSCCPAVERLEIELGPAVSPAYCTPLLQLSALTSLTVSSSDGSGGAAVVGVVVQLTQLKQLELESFSQLLDPTLLQLTSLTALEHLELSEVVSGLGGRCMWSMQNKARPGNNPDVWTQLLHNLLRHAACRQALLKRSTAAAAAPVELMLAQLAATLAEEIAAL